MQAAMHACSIRSNIKHVADSNVQTQLVAYDEAVIFLKRKLCIYIDMNVDILHRVTKSEITAA